MSLYLYFYLQTCLSCFLFSLSLYLYHLNVIVLYVLVVHHLHRCAFVVFLLFLLLVLLCCYCDDGLDPLCMIEWLIRYVDVGVLLLWCWDVRREISNVLRLSPQNGARKGIMCLH